MGANPCLAAAQMTIHITAESEVLLRSLLTTGKYSTESEAVEEALRVLSKRDELRQQIRYGVDELDRGESIPGEVVFCELRAKFAPSAG